MLSGVTQQLMTSKHVRQCEFNIQTIAFADSAMDMAVKTMQYGPNSHCIYPVRFEDFAYGDDEFNIWQMHSGIIVYNHGLAHYCYSRLMRLANTPTSNEVCKLALQNSTRILHLSQVILSRSAMRCEEIKSPHTILVMCFAGVAIMALSQVLLELGRGTALQEALKALSCILSNLADASERCQVMDGFTAAAA
jgi:hypothetical protein